MVPTYSPEARERSGRTFGTHQDYLTKELTLAGATDLESANRYLAEVYMPAFPSALAWNLLFGNLVTPKLCALPSFNP